MHLTRRFHPQALLCSVAVLLCEIISRPYANMGIGDDGPYILVAQKLAATGHIAYNGWSAAMLVWQLYLASAFIKLFGFSFTAVRMSTLLIAVLLAFFLQRVLVLSGINERNATIGTLAFVLSPLYLLLSASFMSDIHGLFGIVLSIYGCLRALRAISPSSAIGSLCFAVGASALAGTSRQLTWLGILVMVPCTLWLLRRQRRILVLGTVVALAGFLFIVICLAWLKRQPYTTPEKFSIDLVHFPLYHVISRFVGFFLELPFLLLPIMGIYLLQLRKRNSRTVMLVGCLLIAFMFLVIYPSHLSTHVGHYLEPSLRDSPGCDWITVNGEYTALNNGRPPIFLRLWIQAFLSAICLGGVIVLILSFFRSSRTSQAPDTPHSVSWKELTVLLGPFASAYALLLVVRAVSVASDNTGMVFDRYSLGLLVVALIYLIRQFQNRLQPDLPQISVAFVLIVAAYGIVVTHNTFALYRARVSIMDNLRATKVPDTAVDNGWEYNTVVELRHADHVNNPAIVTPSDAYVTVPIPVNVTNTCPFIYYDSTPHIHPLYGISFDPNACGGPAPFAPVHYSRWLASSPGTLYVVKYRAP